MCQQKPAQLFRSGFEDIHRFPFAALRHVSGEAIAKAKGEMVELDIIAVEFFQMHQRLALLALFIH
jgi:hypothetical protein